MSNERKPSERRFVIIADGETVANERDYNEAIRTAMRRERVGAHRVIVTETLKLDSGVVVGPFTVYRTGEAVRPRKEES